MFFIGSGGPYKLTDLDKTGEFGGGSGGSGYTSPTGIFTAPPKQRI